MFTVELSVRFGAAAADPVRAERLASVLIGTPEVVTVRIERPPTLSSCRVDVEGASHERAMADARRIVERAASTVAPGCRVEAVAAATQAAQASGPARRHR